jgi:pyrroloquinoline quinone biosynthesis protein B
VRLRILGSAAGGGVPQWNCACANCVEARSGGRVRSRTQDGLALEVAPGSWFLVQCSPDIHAQIRAFPELAPREGRASPIVGVVLGNGDLDHVLGLFSLRESTPLTILATDAVRRGLVDRNAMFRTLERFEGHTRWQPLVLGEATELIAPSGPTGVTVTPHPIGGKVPKHLEGIVSPSDEDNVGLWIRDRRGTLVVVATAAAGPGDWMNHLDGADVLLLDGTFWTSTELVRLGLGSARAEEMAHWPVCEAMAALASLRVRRKVLTHINNTNPLLLEGGEVRAEVEAAGWTIAEDGMEIVT